MHILIVEDDKRITSNIEKILIAQGYQVTTSYNAEEGLYLAKEEKYDAVILDWMLPDESGIKLCEKLRTQHNPTPILMLTAKSQLEDKVEGLTSGADDYLTKPFAKEELLARIKALIRRSLKTEGSPLIEIADLKINTNTAQVTRAGKNINLAPREYDLLEYLAQHKNCIIDRMTLLHHVWGEDIDPFSNTVDVHIRYLRKKIDQGFVRSLIKTVKNKGYMICAD